MLLSNDIPNIVMLALVLGEHSLEMLQIKAILIIS